MERVYTKEELQQLHTALYEIFAEIIRVCEELNISYFIIGGTAIGAHFWQHILPWDDDIDLGMTRENYNRFLREAPAIMSKDFFLQWNDTDPQTPFFFTKMRKNNTLFTEAHFSKMHIHHGIFVDIFPFDKVPDNKRMQTAHRTLFNFLNCCFIGKVFWQWKHCGKCEVEHPSDRGFLPCLATRIMVTLFSKRMIYKMLTKVQCYFNNSKHATYYNNVMTTFDHIHQDDMAHLQKMTFGPLEVTAPDNLEKYLYHHYKNLRKYIPKEEQVNHRPTILSFDTRKP